MNTIPNTPEKKQRELLTAIGSLLKELAVTKKEFWPDTARAFFKKIIAEDSQK